MQLAGNPEARRISIPFVFLDYLITCFILLGSFYAAKSSIKRSFFYYFPSSPPPPFLAFTPKSSFVFISPYHSNIRNLVFSYNLEQRRYYSTGYKNIENNNEKFHPLWITGFIDGEGCFIISVTEKQDRKIGWQVQLSISIGLHEKDIDLLKNLKLSLGVGRIRQNRPSSVELVVKNFQEIEKLINFFEKYPLITQKYADFVVF